MPSKLGSEVHLMREEDSADNPHPHKKYVEAATYIKVSLSSALVILICLADAMF
jgi:hypothetical protein